ncbi:cytochrome P450 4V3 [Annulohypoxylon maeteangense]|uniref:cytochrome P450 4V3 n=1 Tax=Annulohypoxylon maeteangense TaxID=1927788 RepID=UPI0020082ECA|nr:cytochrome P450 4V3 [Annulohypoxylon maeteangense]KAI0886539.1 cytochrome P450 4V3 [Annulohypoxylon maeteangense]
MGTQEIIDMSAVLPVLLRSLGVLSIVVLVRFFYRGYVERSRVRSLMALGIPVLPHSLLFGHLPVFLEFRDANPPDINIYWFHTWLIANAEKYFPGHDKPPPVVYLDLWPMTGSMAAVFDPIAASQFTQVKSLPKDQIMTDFMMPLTGNMDIVSSDGQLWKTWRARFNPGFSARNLTALLPEIIEESLVFVNGLKDLAGKDENWGPVFQFEDKTTNLTLDVIVRASTDLRLHEQSRKSNSPLKTALLEQIKMMGMVTNAARGLPAMRMPWHRAAINRNNRDIRNVLLPQIESKIRSDSSTSVQRKTVVDLAVKYVEKDDSGASKEKLDDVFIDRLIANLKAFMFAGHDTTSSTICFMIKLLQDDPDALAKVRAEHDSVFGPDPEKAAEILTTSPHLLYSLPYTVGVIKETLRLYPLAATVRDSKAAPGFALTVPGSPTRYPMEGFGPWLAVTALHRNADYWPRPNEFLPERWLAVEGDPLYIATKEAWAPFSLGPRNCIGMELAMIELRLVSVLVARTFDIEEAWTEWDKKQGSKATPTHIVNGERLYGVGNGTVHPKDGMPVHVRLRSHKPAP